MVTMKAWLSKRSAAVAERIIEALARRFTLPMSGVSAALVYVPSALARPSLSWLTQRRMTPDSAKSVKKDKQSCAKGASWKSENESRSKLLRVLKKRQEKV
jgi:hypothetical protein